MSIKTIIKTDYPWWKGENQTLYCRCGVRFRGKSKFTYDNKEPVKIIDRPCPSCGDRADIWRTESDPETFTIRS